MFQTLNKTGLKIKMILALPLTLQLSKNYLGDLGCYPQVHYPLGQTFPSALCLLAVGI